MKVLWDLFRAFFTIGAMTFGGGYAMLPMLEREIVQKHKWATQEEILNYFAIGQCTPGIIAVNTATFVGHTVKGTIGSIIATLHRDHHHHRRRAEQFHGHRLGAACLCRHPRGGLRTDHRQRH